MPVHPILLQLWRARWRLVGGAIMGVLIGCIIVLSIRPQYTVRMVVGPVSANGPAGMGTPAARLQDLRREDTNAANSGMDTLTDYDRYLQLLTSAAMAENLIRNVPDILQTLFPDRWNAREKKWQLPLAAWPAEIINRARGGNPWQAPTADDLSNKLDELLQLRVIGATPMRELRLHYPDRGFGLTLLYAMHEAADNVLREEAARRSTSITEYIQKQLQTVRLEEHRRVLSELLASQERIRILVAVNLPYAADIVEPPNAPLQPDTPAPWPIIVFCSLIGTAASAFYTTWPRGNFLLGTR